MKFNHIYQIKKAEFMSKSIKDAKILDYGCGSGNVVKEGRRLGLDIYGADNFFEGNPNIKKIVEEEGLLGCEIKEIINNKLDFEDEFFDFVMSNMVFEHIDDICIVLSEINRVMRKNGLFLCLFPSISCILEGHIKIPFAHWFSMKSRFRYHYIYVIRSLGFGSFKGDITKTQWTINELNYLDKYTHYKPETEIIQKFSKFFNIRFIEQDYISLRIQSKKIAFLFKKGPISKIISILFRKFVFMVILATKK